MRWWRRCLEAIGIRTEAGDGGTPAVSGPLLVHRRTSWLRSPAHARALDLLREHMTPAQRAQFDTLGHFDVVGSSSGRHYRIRIGNLSNVDELGPDGRYVRSWCFAPAGRLPVGDVLLAQKLGLEGYEPEVLKVANAGVRIYA